MRADDTLLVVSYAFPPLKVAMAPCTVKALRSLKEQGYRMDVVSAEIFPPLTSYYDDSMLAYAENTVQSITRLRPSTRGRHARLTKWGDRMVENRTSERLHRWRNTLRQWLNPDAMAALHDAALSELRAKLRSGQYSTLLSFAPFHSVNPVVAQLKKEFARLKWIAQFGDPWAANPLEHNPHARRWAKRHEPRTVRLADHIIHNSQPSLDLMLKRYGNMLADKSSLIYHPFDAALFPPRAKAKNDKITLRYVGVLFEDRTPNPLFAGMGTLLIRRPELAERVRIELVGPIEASMLATPEAKALPGGMVASLPEVPYVTSLQQMYDADILILLEANSAHNLFMPSKLSDYIGAGTPILAIVPPGPAHDTLARLGSPWLAGPSDTQAISLALEQAIDYVLERPGQAWGDSAVRQEFALPQIGARYHAAITKVKNA